MSLKVCILPSAQYTSSNNSISTTNCYILKQQQQQKTCGELQYWSLIRISQWFWAKAGCFMLQKQGEMSRLTAGVF